VVRQIYFVQPALATDLVYNLGDMEATHNIPAGAGLGGAVEYKECFKCRFRGDIAEATCPNCGKKLRTSKNIRVRGAIQLVTGLFLVAMMAGLSIFIWYLTHSSTLSADEAQRIAEQKTMFIGVYALFGIIGLFGLNGIVMGVWQLAFGRRNKPLIWIMFGLLALILIGCLAMTFVVQ
jgi:hypothetical protein